jgi:hypothetical protein
MKAADKEKVIFRLTPETKKALQIKVLQDNTSVQELLEDFVVNYIKEEKKMTKLITLTQEAYANGGSVRAGGNSVYELTSWYEAAAVDQDGNDYRVIWEISDDYDPKEQEEDSACNWDEPWAVLDEHYNRVTDVEIAR